MCSSSTWCLPVLTHKRRKLLSRWSRAGGISATTLLVVAPAFFDRLFAVLEEDDSDER